MTLAFQSEKFFIGPTTGANSQTEQVNFPRDLRVAEVALKEFKLEYTGRAAPTDIVQMGVVVTDPVQGTDSVQFKLSYNYSGGGEYRGHAVVLVIADLVEERAGHPNS
jgi:hypothetical protein